jgi:hypothetical protein
MIENYIPTIGLEGGGFGVWIGDGAIRIRQKIFLIFVDFGG